jgi:hypothetical protein
MNQERQKDIAVSVMAEKAKMAGTVQEETRDQVDVKREDHMEKNEEDIAEDHHGMDHVRILHLESMAVVMKEGRGQEAGEEDLELPVRTRGLDVASDSWD